MCGRFVQASEPGDLGRFLVVDDRVADVLPPRYNVAPTDAVYAVVDHQQRRTLVSFRWGLVPHWSKDPGSGPALINGRVETVAEKPAFRESLASKRCLIPADGFYEWRSGVDGGREPYYIHRRDGRPLVFAGLWSARRDQRDGTVLRTCAILTTKADERLSSLHDRMPVVLDEEAWGEWLGPGNIHPSHLTERARGLPLAYHRVSRAVNRPGVDGPDLIKQLPPEPEAPQRLFE